MNDVILLLACFGLTVILVQSIIVDKLKLRPLWERSKFLKELFNCSMCTGWWVGLYFATIKIFTLHGESFGLSLFIVNTIYYLLTLPFASSGLCWLLENFGMVLTSINDKNDKPVND